MDSMTFTMKHIFYIVLYSTISVVAIGGNGIVIFLISRYRQMRSVTNYFLLNCALGDLLMAMLCIPFTFISNLLLSSWPFGSFMCRLVSYAQAVSVFVSAYTLVAISVDRYIAIIYPLRPRMTRNHGLKIIGVIWLVALLTPFPTALLSVLVPISNGDMESTNCTYSLNLSQIEQTTIPEQNGTLNSDLVKHFQPNLTVSSAIVVPIEMAHEKLPLCTSKVDDPMISNLVQKYQCNEDWSSMGGNDYRTVYSFLLMGLQYLLPFTVLVFTYTRIGIVVWGKQAPGEADDERDAKMAASKRKMVKMMITCVLAFSLSWLPFNTLSIVADQWSHVYEYEYIEYLWFACHWLAMSHAMYNPVIYISMNARFRYGFRSVVGKCVPYLLPEVNSSSNGHSVAHIFTPSQRKRRASQFAKCYSCHLTDKNGPSKLPHGSKAKVLLTSNGATLGCSNNSKVVKRFSFVAEEPPVLLQPGQTTNGKEKSFYPHCEMVKSQSCNVGHPMGTGENGATTTNDSHL